MLRRAVLWSSLVVIALAGGAAAVLSTPRAGAQAPTTRTGTTVATTTSATSTTTTSTATAPVVTVPSTVDSSTAPSTIVITGRGWGHGVGMGQWGVYGYSKHGWTYDRILAHYYRGTTLVRKANLVVRVLLLENAPKAILESASPWSVTDARGTTIELPAGKRTVAANLVVAKQKLVAPLVFSPGSTPLSVAGKPYRGRVHVFASGKQLQVVNALALDEYVRGVVPYEVPYDWPAEALKAQAVAARSYALSGLTAIVTASVFDVYSDTRDQVYGGIEAEKPSTSAAVRATARQVLLYEGKVARTYYSSTTGGRTAAASEWLGRPVPYLVSVSDPYDSLSPYHTWGPVLFDARKVAKALSARGVLLDLRTARGPSGRVQTLTAVGSQSEVAVPGTTVRTALGLRSTWFSVGWLALTPPPKAAYGRPTTLAGTARGVGAVVLEGRPVGGAWQTVATVKPDAQGAFTIAVRPQATTEYRLAASGINGGLIRVPVEPVVRASVDAGAVKGSLRPPLPDTAVQVQRRRGAVWATVATVRTDTKGSFSVARRLAPGSYRIYCAPGRGLVPGVSAMLAVP